MVAQSCKHRSWSLVTPLCGLQGAPWLTDSGLQHLSLLASLQRAELAYLGRITDAGLASLQHLTSLQDLTLSFCNGICGSGMAHLQVGRPSQGLKPQLNRLLKAAEHNTLSMS